MHSVIDNDKDVIDNGKFVENSINQGVSSFTPNLLFEMLVKDYTSAKNIYGESLLRQIFGYDADYIERNIKIPEFQKILQDNMKRKLKELNKQGYLDDEYNITDKGVELATLVMYTEELDNIIPKGIKGERTHKKQSHYGEKDEVKFYRKGDRYKDISIRKSIKTAIRRGHSELQTQDLKVFERQSKGQCYIIYALDASGSMRGKKIGSCKKAGIALAYKAISKKDKVGLIVFGEDIKRFVEPTQDFTKILKEIVKITASKQTDIVKTIKKSVDMFPAGDVTKHLLLLTDALPTTGKDPEKETLDAVAVAADKKITISLIGIGLDKKGERFGKRVAEIGKGNFYRIKNLDEIDKIVLEDYYAVA